MKKISIIVMLASVTMLFAQCKGGENKTEAKEGEAQVEAQDKAEVEAESEEAESEEAEAGEETAIPIEFSADEPTVLDIAVALGKRFSPEIIGEEEAEMENPGPLFEAMAKAVVAGKGAEGEELKTDVEKGTVWFKQTYEKEATVLAVKMSGDKVLVDLRCMLDGAMNPAQFDGTEEYKIDLDKKVLVFKSNVEESLLDDKGELK